MKLEDIIVHSVTSMRSDREGVRLVSEVLELMGIEAVARKRIGRFSLRMFQRLGIAAAMLAILKCSSLTNR